jgi:hypothetical protein
MAVNSVVLKAGTKADMTASKTAAHLVDDWVESTVAWKALMMAEKTVSCLADLKVSTTAALTADSMV